MWEYRAKLIKVIDGDTLDMEIDVGFHGRQIERVRLLGVNTPERGQIDWQFAIETTKDWLVDWQYMGEWPFTIRTEKSDSFGRYLAMIWPEGKTVASLNDYLRACGWKDLKHPYEVPT